MRVLCQSGRQGQAVEIHSQSPLILMSRANLKNYTTLCISIYLFHPNIWTLEGGIRGGDGKIENDGTGKRESNRNHESGKDLCDWLCS